MILLSIFACFNNGVLFSLCLQAELVDLAESIQQKLSYFNELENINTVGCVCLFVRLLND